MGRLVHLSFQITVNRTQRVDVEKGSSEADEG